MTRRPQPRLLLGPGPSTCPPEILEVMARPLMGHLDPEFLELMDKTRAGLRRLFGTENMVTLALPGTGSSGMQAALTNLLEPGDRLVVATNGFFGGRLAEMGRRLGARVETLEFPWGAPVDPGALDAALDQEPAAVVAFVHAETSTGVGSDAATLARVARDRGALVVADCVTSLAGMPVEVDSWGLDVAYSGSQKCLSCPPGLAPITFSERAMHKIGAREAPQPDWYLDVSLLERYWGPERTYHHTAPISLVYALGRALQLVFDEGLESCFERHRQGHHALISKLSGLGLELYPHPEHSLPMLNAIKVPSGVDEAVVRRRLLDEEGIEVGAGLGPLKGQILRIGLMGHSCRDAHVERLVTALARLIG